MLTIVTTFWQRTKLAIQMIEHTANEADAKLVAVISPEDPDAQRLVLAAKDNGWDVVMHANQPLAAKWNAGVQHAKQYGNPVMILGSDDFVCPDWVSMAETLTQSADIVGLSSFLAYRKLTGETIDVSPYPEGHPRHGDSIGSGRTLSVAVLDAVGWKPWPGGMTWRLDSGMLARIGDHMPQAGVLTMDTPGQIVDVREDTNGISAWWDYVRFGEAAELPGWVPDEECDEFVREGSAMVSAGIIATVRDGMESVMLDRAIRTALSIADEVVVLLDDRSMPGWTLPDFDSIRGKFHTWNGFANARNKVAELCSNDWIFVIDADELLVNPGDIREQIENCPDEKCAVGVSAYSVTDNGIEEYFSAVRAYRKSKCHWRWDIHNELFVTETGEEVGADDCVSSTGVIESHYVGTAQEKAHRAIPGMEAAMAEDPSEPRWPFFLSRSYAALGLIEKAISAARQCIELAPENPKYARAYFEMARLQMANGQQLQGEATMAMGLTHHPLFPDIQYLRLMLALGDWHRAAGSPDYTGQPNVSMKYARNVPQIAQLLGLTWTANR